MTAKRFVLFTLGSLSLGAAALFAQAPATFKLQVVVSKYEGGRKVSEQPFYFLLAPNQKGTLRVTSDIKDAALSEGQSCMTSAALSSQQIGTEVESLVAPAADGQFKISVSIHDRSWRDCRNVGGVSVPVFANTAASHDITLKSGQTVEVAESAARKVSITLSPGDAK